MTILASGYTDGSIVVYTAPVDKLATLLVYITRIIHYNGNSSIESKYLTKSFVLSPNQTLSLEAGFYLITGYEE